jgi:hypothetical protein
MNFWGCLLKEPLHYRSLAEDTIGFHLNILYIVGGGVPLTINVRLQMVCTFIGTLCKYATCTMQSSLMLLVGGWLRWPGDL